MVLATPGHPGTDCPKAQKLLRELIATQETLLPAERAMAFLTLQNVDQTLSQTAQIQRLQTAADHSDRDRYAAARTAGCRAKWTKMRDCTRNWTMPMRNWTPSPISNGP